MCLKLKISSDPCLNRINPSPKFLFSNSSLDLNRLFNHNNKSHHYKDSQPLHSSTSNSNLRLASLLCTNQATTLIILLWMISALTRALPLHPLVVHSTPLQQAHRNLSITESLSYPILTLWFLNLSRNNHKFKDQCKYQKQI